MFINGPVFAMMMRVLYCTELEKFIELYGEDSGRYLWDKFKVHYNGNVGDFICYLDGNNVEILFQYLAPEAVIQMYGGKNAKS